MDGWVDGWMGGWIGGKVKDCLQQSKIDYRELKALDCTK